MWTQVTISWFISLKFAVATEEEDQVPVDNRDWVRFCTCYTIDIDTVALTCNS